MRWYLALLLVVAFVLPAPPARAEELAWEQCGEAECATLRVPVDWSRPSGPRITLALARHQATEPDRRIGTLVFVPGMGVSAMEVVANGAAGFFNHFVPAPELVRRFDLVGIDPRGGGVHPAHPPQGPQLPPPRVESTPLNCVRPVHDPAISGFPTTTHEVVRLAAHNRRFGLDCLARTGPLAANLDARSHARDLEAVRKALGEPRLNLLAWPPHGTLIGQTYAHLFPERVRTMVLDSPSDPGLPMERYVGDYAREVEAQFNRFTAWCATAQECALHGRDAGADFDAIVAGADHTPIPADTMHSLRGEHLRFLTEELLALGDVPVFGYGTGWQLLAMAIDEIRTTGRSTIYPLAYHGSVGWPGLWNPFRAGSCLDHATEPPAALPALVRQVTAAAPHMKGTSLGWDMMAGCAGWPVPPKAGRNPLPVRGAILVIANSGNPWGPADHARRVVRRIDGGTLLMSDGSGHLASVYPCVADHMVDHLVTGQVPPAGTSCAEQAAEPGVFVYG